MTVNEVASPVQSEAAAIGAAECRQGWFPLGVNKYGDQPFKMKQYKCVFASRLSPNALLSLASPKAFSWCGGQLF